MKQRNGCPTALVVFLGVFSVLYASGLARAESQTGCTDGKLGQRITSCSAVIENPATTAFDLERALEIRSVDHLLAKRHADALQDLDRVLQLNPRSALALNGRAWTLYRWKKSSEGMDDVNASLRIDGSYAPAWDTRAHLYQHLGQFDRAFNEYEAAIGFGGESFIRTYQCGLRERGLYKGPVDGIYSITMRAALKTCVFSESCDPLPENEYEQECDSVTS
jgi:tetratricopeptide (TPR) repeat protein